MTIIWEYFWRSVFGEVWLLIWLTTSSGVAEEGWPFVRGADFDGHSAETGILDDWPSQGPPVLWTRKLGQGYSAFVAQADRVYTQAQNMTGQYLYCLNGDTGETIWEYRYDWPYESAGVYPGPRSTPTLADGRVCFASPDGLLGCVDQADGGLIWSVDLQQVYGLSGCDFGYSCSPTLIDGMVIVPVGGENAGVVAFDAKSGTEIWRSTSAPASYTPAFPIELDGQPLVVCYMQNNLLILDRATGAVRREIGLSQGYDEHSAWPIYREPHLWLSGPFRSGSYLLDLTNLDDPKQDLHTVWRSKLLSNDVCSSVCVDGHIYGFDIFDVQSKTHRPSRGIFRCLELSTGKESWSVGTGRPRRSTNADEFSSDIGQSGIVVADGKLIVLNELGELILLKADDQECVELARCMILSGELTWTPPCLNRGRVYVRNQSQAVCVYLGDPQNLSTQITLHAGDLPQRQYYNLAAAILAVEPEYAFDVPHRRWLVQWYLVGLAVLILARLLVTFLNRFSAWIRSESVANFLVAFLLGAIGTTLLGRLTGEFVFTWPVCLFAALEFVATPENPNSERGTGVWPFFERRIGLAVFLAVNVIYFLICRRLSLVFEWAFLTGFVGGLPIVWFARRFQAEQRATYPVWSAVCTLLGFSAFYGSAVVFLTSRY